MIIKFYEALDTLGIPLINFILLIVFIGFQAKDGKLTEGGAMSVSKRIAGYLVGLALLGAFMYLKATQGTSLQLFNLILVFVDFMIFSIFIGQMIMKTGGEEELEKHQNEGSSDVLEKKYSSADLSTYGFLFAGLGWALSIGVVLGAMEYPSFEEQVLMDLGDLDVEAEEQIEVPQTFVKPPPPPKITVPAIVEVPDETEIEEEIEIEIPEFDQEMEVEEFVEPEMEDMEEEVVEEIFEIVEDPAAPAGGIPAFLGWVGKNIKYPAQARRMGVEGKVYVQFVVDKDGSLTNVQVVRGIGAGCDEEAVRVIQKAKPWKPGKQRGRPVKQRIILPINFKLG
ncbi:energy transducer TonB [Sediminitomix flava]|uniref:TonB family protein n=1 Tax=Sediminitomix flava TaxID=379075 RepID=A0A315ZCL2_SEDFL|nr:energy transducer TonB [Sediminitomix flava]PWJ43050.1 TonB family protein [Sediminitomix flava]